MYDWGCATEELINGIWTSHLWFHCYQTLAKLSTHSSNPGNQRHYGSSFKTRVYETLYKKYICFQDWRTFNLALEQRPTKIWDGFA